MNEREIKIENLILGVLSFYEAMSFELILLDMPQEEILNIPDFNRGDLEKSLEVLVKKKKVKKEYDAEKKEETWIKLFPRKTFIQKILSAF